MRSLTEQEMRATVGGACTLCPQLPRSTDNNYGHGNPAAFPFVPARAVTVRGPYRERPR